VSDNKRKTFNSAQKAKVALEAIKGLKTINQIAQEHNVHPTQVNQWKKELLANAGFRPNRSQHDALILDKTWMYCKLQS
jgi:transposase-like protein